MNRRNEVLIMRLKSGEYDGTHIMKAWITIQEQENIIAELEEELTEAIEIIEYSGVDYDEVLEAIRGGAE